ncbi:MAG: ABC transporter substrate-binding protein [Burkholderiales bacterium]|nr:ABC transporter substrate-binding protein [Burkholderiales bacterium]
MMSRSLFLAALLMACTAHAQVPRVVAVGGAITEIVYALGAEGRLVGVDTTSLFPPEAQKLPKVGYQRQLAAEGLLSLRPTVVLATSEAGPPTVISQLKGAGVRFETVSADHSFEEVRNKVRVVANALGLSARGAELDSSLTRDWQSTQAYVAAEERRAPKKPRVLFLLLHSASGGLMASGQGTAADAMIRYAGGVNAVSGYTGYKTLADEALIAAAPDFVLLTQQGLDAVGGVDKLWQRPGLALSPAAKQRRYAAPDALYLLGFGPRLPQAVREVATHIRSGT